MLVMNAICVSPWLFCVVASSLCGAQDVASPSMPNVDLEKQSGITMKREKEAVRKFFVLFYISYVASVLEKDGDALNGQNFYSRLLAGFPGKELKECPRELQELMNVRVREMKDMAAGRKERGKTILFDSSDPEVQEFLGKYGMENLFKEVEKWMWSQINSRIDARRMRDSEEKYLNNLVLQFVEDVRSGNLVMPEELEE